MTKAWLSAIRIHTLPVGTTPVILGVSFAAYQNYNINIITAFMTLTCCLLLQAASNLVNDYYDGIRGTDSDDRIGFQRATSSGLIDAHKVKYAFIIFFLIAFVIGLYLTLQTGILIFLIGILSILSAYIYTGGPFPLSHYALGEVFALIFFGPVAVFGSFFIQSHHYSMHSIILGLVPGFFAAAIMAINNLRDREQDIKAGKRTLANLFNEFTARLLVIFLIIVGNLCILFFAKDNLYAMLSLVPFFLFSKTWKKIILGKIDQGLNLSLKSTGKYLTLTGIILSLTFLF